MPELTREEKRERKAKLRIDLAKHLVEDHGWRATAAVGLEYMLARHMLYACDWRNLNKDMREITKEA